MSWADSACGLSPTTVRRLLARSGLGPAPRESGPGWREFRRAQAESIVACHFFTIESALLRRDYVLFFIAHANRRVWLAGGTTTRPGPGSPNRRATSASTSPTRACASWARDRDSKTAWLSTKVSAAIVSASSSRPCRRPRRLTIAERLVRTVRRDCVYWLLIVNRRHLERVVRISLEHYSTQRPHRGLQLQPPQPQLPPPAAAIGEIHRHDRLGGLIHEYYRAAA